MYYLLSWFVVGSLLALWSLSVWALHAVATWSIANAGAISGAASGVGSIVLPEALAPWVPVELVQAVTQLVASLGPLVDSVLQAVPALAGGLTIVAWGIWAIGGALLVMLGAAGHVLIMMWRRRGSGGSGPGTGPSWVAR
jgi:hypothetical protein